MVEDNAAEQLSIGELLGTTTSRSTPPHRPAPRRSRACGTSPPDCVVLDLRLPDMSGFDVLEEIRRDDALARPPGRRLHRQGAVGRGGRAAPDTMARSIVVKGVESPERLLDETALFLHRVVADLPAGKQRMLERLHRSDEDLVGKRCWWSTTTCATSSR